MIKNFAYIIYRVVGVCVCMTENLQFECHVAMIYKNLAFAKIINDFQSFHLQNSNIEGLWLV